MRNYTTENVMIKSEISNLFLLFAPLLKNSFESVSYPNYFCFQFFLRVVMVGTNLTRMRACVFIMI